MAGLPRPRPAQNFLSRLFPGRSTNPFPSRPHHGFVASQQEGFARESAGGGCPPGRGGDGTGAAEGAAGAGTARMPDASGHRISRARHAPAGMLPACWLSHSLHSFQRFFFFHS